MEIATRIKYLVLKNGRKKAKGGKSTLAGADTDRDGHLLYFRVFLKMGEARSASGNQPRRRQEVVARSRT